MRSMSFNVLWIGYEIYTVHLEQQLFLFDSINSTFYLLQQFAMSLFILDCEIKFLVSVSYSLLKVWSLHGLGEVNSMKFDKWDFVIFSVFCPFYVVQETISRKIRWFRILWDRNISTNSKFDYCYCCFWLFCSQIFYHLSFSSHF